MRSSRGKWRPRLTFTTRSLLMETGSMWKATVSAGSQRSRLSTAAGVPIATGAAGCGVIRAGIGIGLGPALFPWVPIRHLGDPLWRHHLVARGEGRALYNRSTVINNYVVRNNTVINQGMPRDRIVSMTGATIPKATLVDARVP